MMTIDWALQAILSLLLVAAIPFAFRLQRQIAILRREHAALGGGTAELEQATIAAESALTRLRTTVENSMKLLNDRLSSAGPLREDLRFLNERAELLANRLEGAVQAARPVLAGALPHAEAVAAAPPGRDSLRTAPTAFPAPPQQVREEGTAPAMAGVAGSPRGDALSDATRSHTENAFLRALQRNR